MVEHKHISWKRRLDAAWFPILIGITALTFVYVGSGYRGDAGRFPVLVGWITAVLALFEAISRLRALRPEDLPSAVPLPVFRHAAAILLWFGGLFVCLYLIGVIATIALLGAIYFYALAELRLLPSVMAGLAHAAFFHVAFGLLAGFRLFPGVLFQ